MSKEWLGSISKETETLEIKNIIAKIKIQWID